MNVVYIGMGYGLFKCNAVWLLSICGSWTSAAVDCSQEYTDVSEV